MRDGRTSVAWNSLADSKCAIRRRFRPSVKKRSLASWYATAAFVVLWAVGYGANALRSDKMELFRRAGFSDNEIKQIELASHFQFKSMAAMICVGGALALAFLVYAKRYFGAISPTPTANSVA